MTDITIPTYEIEHFNKASEIEITGGIIDFQQTPLALIGKLTPNYGAYQSQNFLWLMENFANTTEPNFISLTLDPAGHSHAVGYYKIKPVIGMLYFNTTEKCLYICSEISGTQEYLDKSEVVWKKMLTSGSTQPTNPSVGDLWFDVDNNCLKCYNGSYWIIIGPSSLATKKHQSATGRTYNTSSQRSVVIKINTDENAQSLFPANSTSLVTINVVGKENGTNPISATYRNCIGLIIKAVIQSDSDGKLSIVGNPDTEMIGRSDTSYTTSWGAEIDIDNTQGSSQRFGVEVSGIVSYATTDPSVNRVDWVVDLTSNIV